MSKLPLSDKSRLFGLGSAGYAADEVRVGTPPPPLDTSVTGHYICILVAFDCVDHASGVGL